MRAIVLFRSSVLVGVVATIGTVGRLSEPAAAVGVRSRVHALAIAVPVPSDFTLATVKVNAAATGLAVSTISGPKQVYVAAAATRRISAANGEASPPAGRSPDRSSKWLVFVLIVNRRSPGSAASTPQSVSVRIKTASVEPKPEFSEQVDVLNRGVSGQDCSALTYDPDLKHPYLWGSQLAPLVGSVETVADAVDQACRNEADSQFERWVRQEPAVPHP